ncbi:MAG TPA: tRNA preQ1(34) S-adenosylmethionine ribosyltransferase-isomerase QueA [Nitrospirota bacterium]|nr:tRNA preQ1(34) S-adenosylmethionine ribosyltransferase-isomerase QueA [Nitrospirota bacterium]
MNTPAAEQLRLSDFDYELPEALIAQEPASERDHSRLMVLDRSSGVIEHKIFADLEKYLLPGDLLVLNDTRVFPCRLPAAKQGGGRSEIFLLSELDCNLWVALVKGGVGEGKRLVVSAGVEAEIVHEHADGTRTVRFHSVDDIRGVLDEIGRVPLPPYIRRDPSRQDRERYQTVYASREGAVAAPTAGLHFSRDLLAALVDKGVELVTVTLHVGPGTFQPVRSDRIVEHRMLPERYSISTAAAAAINKAKAGDRRVIAVGTTSVRTIETASRASGSVIAGEGASELFIYPGYKFKVTGGIITNFHLPKSTLLMLVSAFAGRERILSAYRTAIAERYRFYSYGDAMLIE